MFSFSDAQAPTASVGGRSRRVLRGRQGHCPRPDLSSRPGPVRPRLPSQGSASQVRRWQLQQLREALLRNRVLFVCEAFTCKVCRWYVCRHLVRLLSSAVYSPTLSHCISCACCDSWYVHVFDISWYIHMVGLVNRITLYMNLSLRACLPVAFFFFLFHD